ncbi:MAG: DNA alkylation repair protein [Pseudomonadota bacterium]
MPSLKEALKKLEAHARPDQLDGMARYGMRGEKRLGVAIPAVRKLAKEIGKDHGLALRLWRTGIPDAMILASMVDDPGDVTREQMEQWVMDIDSWDVCDQLCMNLFEKVPFAPEKIRAWSKRDEEFVRRAAFAMIACMAWHDKGAADGAFIELLPVIKKGAEDERNMVKKAVSWALRNIGKRNPALNAIAIKTAEEIRKMDGKAARWIASAAIRDLTSETARRRLGK